MPRAGTILRQSDASGRAYPRPSKRGNPPDAILRAALHYVGARLTTTSSTWASVIRRGTPGRGSSHSPSSRSRRKPGPPPDVRAPVHLQSRCHRDARAAVCAGQHNPGPQRQALRGRAAPHPVLQRPPLLSCQHQRLQPRITHTRSTAQNPDPVTTSTKAATAEPRSLRQGTTHVVTANHQLRSLAAGP